MKTKILLYIIQNEVSGGIVALRWFIQWLHSTGKFDITVFHVCFLSPVEGLPDGIRQIGCPSWVTRERLGVKLVIKAICHPRYAWQKLGYHLQEKFIAMPNWLSNVFCVDRTTYDVAISFADNFTNYSVRGFWAKRHFGWNHEDYQRHYLATDQRSRIAKGLRLLDAVFCVSETSCRSLQGLLQNNFPPVYVFHNLYPVQAVSLSPLPRSCDTRLRLLSVGRMVKEKNFELVLDIAEKIRDLGVDFSWDVCGDGYLKGKLEDETALRGLTSSVRFIGTCSDWREKYDRSVIYVQTSYAEGWGLALEEAALSGHKVVCSDIPIFHEVSEFLGVEFGFARTADDFVTCIEKVREARDVEVEVVERIMEKYREDQERFIRIVKGEAK